MALLMVCVFPHEPEEWRSFVNSNVGRDCLPASLHVWSAPEYNFDERILTALLRSSVTVSLCFICVKPVALITYSDVCIAAFIQLHLLLYKLRTLAFLLPGITSYICTSRLIINTNCFPFGLEVKFCFSEFVVSSPFICTN